MADTAGNLEGYDLLLLRTPVPQHQRRGLAGLLAHKGEPWFGDIVWRLDRAPADLFAVACRGGQAVANVWMGRSGSRPDVALLGHVFTKEEHRRHGLCSRLLGMIMAEFSSTGGRWVTLGTGNPGAMRLYEREGFGDLSGSRAQGHVTMLRPAQADALRSEYAREPTDCVVEPYQRDHYAGACLMLAVVAEGRKLPLLGIDTGLEAESRLLHVLDEREQGDVRCWAMTDSDSGLVRGLACAKDGRTEAYAPGVDRELDSLQSAVE